MSINEIFNMYFGIIEYPRDEANTKHSLINILKLIMIAILCGMDELDKIIDYGNKSNVNPRKSKVSGLPSPSCFLLCSAYFPNLIILLLLLSSSKPNLLILSFNAL